MSRQLDRHKAIGQMWFSSACQLTIHLRMKIWDELRSYLEDRLESELESQTKDQLRKQAFKGAKRENSNY